MSPHCVWIITVGGADKKLFVNFPDIVMLTELGTVRCMLHDYCNQCGLIG